MTAPDCLNCGHQSKGGHYVPPMTGDPGFFACESFCPECRAIEAERDVKVRAFGFDRPEPDVAFEDAEGMRAGVIALAWVVGAFVAVSVAAVCLIAYGVTHP